MGCEGQSSKLNLSICRDSLRFGRLDPLRLCKSVSNDPSRGYGEPYGMMLVKINSSALHRVGTCPVAFCSTTKRERERDRWSLVVWCKVNWLSNGFSSESMAGPGILKGGDVPVPLSRVVPFRIQTCNNALPRNPSVYMISQGLKRFLSQHPRCPDV